MAPDRDGLTPREIARVLFRHQRKMALVFCSVVALTLVGIAIYPRSYSSESKLFMQVGRESVALDPTATTGQTMLLQKSQVDEINSALDMLTSSEVQQRVVELLGPERILKDQSSDSSGDAAPATFIDRIHAVKSTIRAWVDPMLKGLRLSDPASDVDMAIRCLADGLTVWAPKESTIITVEYQASSPDLAHDVVDATTKAFLEQHVRLNHVEGSLEFFSEQAETLHAKLVAAQTELRDRKNEFQMASLGGKRAIFEDQIKDVELQLLSAQRDLAFSEARATDLTRTIAGLDPEIVTSRVAGVANDARDGMREKLYELEIQESKLRSSYQENHPLLIQIRRQRQEAEEILAGTPDDRTETTSSLNPNQRQLELQLFQAQADAKALRARQLAAQNQLDTLHEQLVALNDRELRIGELDRNVGILEGKYRMHVEKLEQARLNEALSRGQIMNVKVAQPATIIRTPVAPKKRLLMALGLMVATGGALGLALVAETLDQTLRTSAQVEKELGVPVVFSFARRKQRRAASKGKTIPVAAKSNGQSSDGTEHYWADGHRGFANGLHSTNGNGKPHGKTVGIVGCDGSKLRSRVAAMLAMRAAKRGAGPVLLIDGDARRRRVAKRFHVGDSPGWREVLGGVADVESCIHRSKAGNLAVMAPGATGVGTITAEPVNGAIGQLDEIKTEYELVVVDLPASRELEGVAISAEWIDEIVLVVEAERTRIQAARRAKDVLARAGMRVSGVVLANRREHVPRWLYQRL